MPSTLSLFLKALVDVQATLAAHVEPNGHIDEETITTLRTILGDERLVAAMHLAAQKPDGLKAIEAVKAVFAEFARELSAPFDGTMPIATLRNAIPERSYLLFCPEQGGWQAGRRIEAKPPRWVTTTSTELELQPTHWMSAPAAPS
jgi:hypothetical protein